MKAVIFDWSGTLVDNFPAYEKVIAEMFLKLGRQPLTTDELRNNFTLPYMKFWHRFFPDLSKEAQDELFMECTKGKVLCKPFDGIVPILEGLKRKGIIEFVVSSDNHKDLMQEAEFNNMSGYFSAMYGGVYEKQEKLREIICENGFRDVIYVGDTSGDVEAGKSAGVYTIGVTWGFQTQELVVESNPDFVANDVDELKGILLNFCGVYPGK